MKYDIIITNLLLPLGHISNTSSADHNTSIKMLKEVIFPRFRVPIYLMTDGGSHFIHGAFRKMLAK